MQKTLSVEEEGYISYLMGLKNPYDPSKEFQAFYTWLKGAKFAQEKLKKQQDIFF